LFFFFSGGQPHLFALLLVHEFADGSLGLLVEICEEFGVVDFGGIDLWIALKYGAPDPFLSFLQI
jgi:hypothetical protein